MKNISKGSRFAVLAFLFIALAAAAYGVRDLSVHGDAGGAFWFAGIMAVIAAGIYVGARRTDIVPALALLLLAGAAAGCARLASRAEQRAVAVDTYVVTNPAGFADTVKVQPGW